jgi:hypothetical protein
MANPPYAKLLPDGKRTSKNHTLVRDFLAKSLDLLNDNGYLVYLIPDNWMSLADRNIIVKELTKYQFIHLNIHGAKKWFSKVGSSFTWFIIKKTPPSQPFSVEARYKQKTFIDNNVTCQKRDYIPLIYNSIVQSILSKTIDNSENQKFHVETSSNLHKFTQKDFISTQKDDTYIYKLIHTPKQVVFSKIPHKYQTGYKVFISTTDKYSTFIDECGMTQSIAFIRCENKETAEDTNDILNHNLYRFINNICRWGNFNNIRILQRFPIPSNKNDIYNAFEINDIEKQFIEDYLVM